MVESPSRPYACYHPLRGSEPVLNSEEVVGEGSTGLQSLSCTPHNWARFEQY